MPVANVQTAILSLLQVGNGGSPTATKATVNIGAGAAQIKFTAVTGGTAGNSITVAIVVAGNNTALTVGVAGTAITINSATNGGGTPTSTANDCIAAVYATAAAIALATPAATGTGTGVVAAVGATNLAGGAAGVEAFTTIGGVESITGPTIKQATIDVTHMDSPNRTREFYATLIDPGTLTFVLQLVPSGTQHRAILTDMTAQTKRDFQIVIPDGPGSTLSMVGFYTDFSMDFKMDNIIRANMAIKLTGLPNWTV